MQVCTGQIASRRAEIGTQAVRANESRVATYLVERAHSHGPDRVHAIGPVFAADEKQMYARSVELECQSRAIRENCDFVHPLHVRDELRACGAGIEKHVIAVAD